MKKTILNTILLLLLITSATGLTITNPTTDAQGQIRYLPHGDIVAWASDTNTIQFYDEDGYIKKHTNTGQYNAIDFIDEAVGEEGTNNLYWYNQTNNQLVILYYDNNSDVIHDYSSYTMVNEHIVAVTSEWYVITHYETGSHNNTPMSVYNKTDNTLIISLNGTYNCDGVYHSGAKYTCANAQYDPDNDDVYIPVFGDATFMTFHVAKINKTGTIPTVTTMDSVINVNNGLVDEYNDVCNLITYGNDKLITCSQGSTSIGNPYETVYNITGDNSAKPSRSGVITRWNDNNNKMLYVTETTYNLNVLETSNSYDSVTGNNVLYGGSLLKPLVWSGLRTLGSSHYKILGETIYYVDNTSQTRKAEIGEEYALVTRTYTQPFTNTNLYSDYIDTPTYFLTNDGTTVTDPYNTTALEYCVNCIPKGYPQVPNLYIAGNLIEEGSQKTLSLVHRVDNPYNNTISIKLECEEGEYDSRYIELWTDDADTIIERYDLEVPYATMTYGANPIEEYTDDVTEQESDNAKAIIIRNDTTITATLGGLNNEELFIGHFSLLQAGAELVTTLNNRVGNDIMVLNASTVTGRYTITINDEEVVDEELGVALTGYVEYVITLREGTLNYEIAGVVEAQGQQTTTNDAPVQWLTMTTSNEPYYVIIGSYALIEGGTGTWTPSTPIDYNSDYSYYEGECVYTDTDEHDILISYSNDYGATTTEQERLTYSYNPSLLINEVTGEESGDDAVIDEEGLKTVQAQLCDTTGICTDNSRLLFAVFVMIAILISTMHALNERYHQTQATQSIPFLLFALLFITFAVFGFFPTWFTILGAIASAVVIATKYSFFNMGGSSRGGE